MNRSELYDLNYAVTEMARRYGDACADLGVLIGRGAFDLTAPEYLRLAKVRTRRLRALRRLTDALAYGERAA